MDSSGALGEAVAFLEHFQSLPDARQRLALGQVMVNEKLNEIVAIPKLSDLLAIEGAIVTVDAMGCQRDIAAKIIDKKADYDLALKGDHGRIETRKTIVIHDVAWLEERHDRPALRNVVVVESIREVGDKIEIEIRYYITSLVLAAALVGPIIRSHWAIENSPHLVMDMIFPDDECRVRVENAPANFTILKHTAHNLIRKAPGEDSLRPRREVAAWDDDFLASLIAA